MLRLLLAMLAVCGFVAHAQAADKFDVWINLFSEGRFSVERLDAANTTSSTDQYVVQNVRGRIDGRGLLFVHLQRSQPGGGFVDIEQNLNKKEQLVSRVKQIYKEAASGVEPGAYRRIDVNDGVGSALDYQSDGQEGCVFLMAGLAGKATTYGAHQYYMMAIGCAEPAVLLNYMSRIKLSDRLTNIADFNSAR